MMVENGFLSPEGMIENMAQTAAAGVGYSSLKKGTPPPIGFIGAISKLSVYNQPGVNQEISTEIVTTNQIMNVTVIRGKVFLKDELMAECEMKIFIDAS
jgi:hypothetical protein